MNASTFLNASPQPRRLADLPSPTRLPLVGNVVSLRPGRAHRVYEDWHARYGPAFITYFGRWPVLALSDGDAIATILRERPEGFRRIRSLERVMREMGLPSVFNAEGEDWRRQRKLVMHALDARRVEAYWPTLRQVTERLMARWERAADASAPIDVQRELMRYTVDVTTGLALGRDFNTLDAVDDAVQRDIERIFVAMNRRMNAPLRWWRTVRLPSDRALDAALARLRAMTAGLARAARGRLAEDPRPRNLLEALIVASQETAADGTPGLAEDELFGNVVTILLGGEDTTANTLSWMLHYLTLHPQVMARARQEADAVIGSGAMPASYADLDRLPWIDAVAAEAMRLRPVGPLLAWEANHDCVLAGVDVPARTSIVTLMRPQAISDRNFADAAAFRPERWLDDAPLSPHDPKASLPFGAGPRFCPGRRLAMAEIRLATAALLRAFDIERACPDEIEEAYAVTMMPVGLKLRVRRRGQRRT